MTILRYIHFAIRINEKNYISPTFLINFIIIENCFLVWSKRPFMAPPSWLMNSPIMTLVIKASCIPCFTSLQHREKMQFATLRQKKRTDRKKFEVMIAMRRRKAAANSSQTPCFPQAFPKWFITHFLLCIVRSVFT